MGKAKIFNLLGVIFVRGPRGIVPFRSRALMPRGQSESAYDCTLTQIQQKSSWSTSKGPIIMGAQKLSPQGQRLRIVILTVPIMAATSGSQLS